MNGGEPRPLLATAPRRAIASLLPWIACVPALAFSLPMGIFGGYDAFEQLGLAPDLRREGYRMGTAGLAFLATATVTVPAAWGLLLVLTAAWIVDRRLGRALPVAGTATALAALLAITVATGIAMFFIAIVTASPGIGFAAYLWRFHAAGDPAR